MCYNESGAIAQSNVLGAIDSQMLAGVLLATLCASCEHIVAHGSILGLLFACAVLAPCCCGLRLRDG